MSGERQRRWDDAVEEAWRALRRRLADRLAALEDGESVLVQLERGAGSGVSPYCQAARDGEALRVEAVSNVYLAGACRLDDAQEEALRVLGFRDPETDDWQQGPTNHWLDLTPREADLAAVTMVRALREVFGVLHPVFLTGDDLVSGHEGDAHGSDSVRARPIPPRPRPEAPVEPSSPDDLRRAVDLAVRGLLDVAPEWDADGDLPLPTEHGWVWVVVSEAAPRLLLSAPLVDDVVDEARALVEVNLLNLRQPGLTFSLRERRVAVSREIDAAVVIPAQLRLELERLTSQVDGWALDLVTRVGGRCMDEQTPRQPAGAVVERPAGDRFATAYAVMVELEREQRGSVGPATMARIFEHDTGLLLKAVRINEQRRREVRAKAREARAQGRRRAEQLARARQDYLRELTSRMRAALRLLVDAPVRSVQLDQLALFEEDDCGTGR